MDQFFIFNFLKIKLINIISNSKFFIILSISFKKIYDQILKKKKLNIYIFNLANNLKLGEKLRQVVWWGRI